MNRIEQLPQSNSTHLHDSAHQHSLAASSSEIALFDPSAALGAGPEQSRSGRQSIGMAGTPLPGVLLL